MYNSHKGRKKQNNSENYFCHDERPVEIKGRTGKYVFVRCESPHCKLHWRRYAYKVYQKVVKAKDEASIYYDVTLPLPRGTSKTRWSYLLQRWARKLRNQPGKVSYFWVRHFEGWSENYHVLLRSDIPLDIEGIKTHFWNLLSEDEQAEVKFKEVWCEATVSYEGTVWYYLTRDKATRPPLMPWRYLYGTVSCCSKGFLSH